MIASYNTHATPRECAASERPWLRRSPWSPAPQCGRCAMRCARTAN